MDKKLLRVLKAQKTRLLNSNPKTEKESELIQSKLNDIEIQIMLIENDKHIPRID